MLYQGIFVFPLILRALFLFTRPGLAAFKRILVYGDAYRPFPIAQSRYIHETGDSMTLSGRLFREYRQRTTNHLYFHVYFVADHPDKHYFFTFH